MNISPEDRVNMSLDDLIKVSKKTTVKTNNRPATSATKKGKGGVTVKPNSGATPNKNVAKVIGAGKAKREAATNQRRGLNATGKATLKAIKNAVNKAATPGKGKPNQRRPVAAGGKPAVTTGLKITFKPKELGQTTPSQVLQQIKGALAKQGKPRAPGQTKRGGGARAVGNKPATGRR